MRKYIFSILVMAIIASTSTRLYAQDLRYVATPFKPSLSNPAYRFDNKLIDITAIYGIPYSSDLNNTKIHLDAHSQFRSDMGIGVKANYYTPSDLRTEILGGASYNYSIEINDNMDFSAGIGLGVFSTQFSKSLNEVKNINDGYFEIGFAYRWTNLYFGLSSILMFKDKDYGSFSVNAKYDIKICNNFTLSPLVGYTYYSKYQGTDNLGGIIDAGVIFGFNKWAEVGVAYASNNIINTYVSVWASDYVRVFYNGGIATQKEMQQYAPIRNEVGLRFMLNRK